MEKIQLQLFFQIIGIGSASGLLYHNDLLYVISDNSTYFYEYKLETKTLTKIGLTENPTENISKIDKLDFESITLYKDDLYIFGSGSTENRNIVISYSLKNKEVTKYNQSKNFRNLEKKFHLKPQQLNIEGVFYYNDFAYMFQRGNGLNNQNGIFKIHNFGKQEPQFYEITLPKINSIEASFTDAILVGETIYFLAAVENTNSTYNDGEILGTFLGKIKLDDFSLIETKLISDKNKFEGITLFRTTENEIEFLLCEDNDTHVLESTIYKLTLSK